MPTNAPTGVSQFLIRAACDWAVRRLPLGRLPLWHAVVAVGLLAAFPGESCRADEALNANSVAAAVASPLEAAAPLGTPAVRFNRDIRPILSDACFKCHGPDSTTREADLRLDQEAMAKAEREGGTPIVEGRPEASELLRRIASADPDVRMPPPSEGAPLSHDQMATIRRWIELGASWEPHWSLSTPTRPATPPVGQSQWVRNPIDAFVLRRLEDQQLAPSPEASKETLIRRVTLDLTGLPPTLEEVDAFVNDRADDAYERVVDRLLRSDRYGERMASAWLDVARYADTSGYQSDGPRAMWRWRDWVIEALNANMPFDRFTVEQLAGDMLPNASLSQKIATGFNRNHRGNSEGGIIPEEYAVEYVCDRVETTAAVWLGLTIGCARCHEHKYDPIAQREYYQLFAFFNNIPEHGRALKQGNSPPFIPAPTPDQEAKLRELDAAIAEAAQACAALETNLDSAQRAWESTAGKSALSGDWIPAIGLQAHYAFEDQAQNLTGRSNPAAWIDGAPRFADGKIGKAIVLDGAGRLSAGDVARFGMFNKFSISFWINPQPDASGAIVSRMLEPPEGRGYSIALADGKIVAGFSVRWLDDAIRVETTQRLVPQTWNHVVVTYDGSRLARGVRIFIDGKPAPLHVQLDFLNQDFVMDEPLLVGAGNSAGRFRGNVDQLQVFDRDVTEADARILATAESILQIAALPPAQRTASQAEKLRAYYLEAQAPYALRRAFRDLASLRADRQSLVESFPTVMVMEEMAQPRATHVLTRGQYDKPAQRVDPDVPASLPPLPKEAQANRLELARWLVAPTNPLTARVAVNRFWQTFYGIGLVKTAEDFGAQGEPPSHPELLDWLAVEFMESGWNVKAMQRLIVTSAAYRQSSKADAGLLKRDPENRLLARGPRVRLPAETIRDQALAISGLLVERLGGPSVKPYQPAGLWKDIATDAVYDQAQGENLYRRSLYSYWKRTVPPPNMMTFDAAGREICSVRQSRTNTPLQALTLMNDVAFVEAARAFAQRILAREGNRAGATLEDRLAWAFRLATARPPRTDELQVLVENYHRQRDLFARDRDGAAAFVTVGDSPVAADVDVGELAACTATASLILNLDETIMKD